LEPRVEPFPQAVRDEVLVNAILSLIAIVFLSLSLADTAATSGNSEPIRMGLAESLVRDEPPTVVETGLPLMRYLLQQVTGVRRIDIPILTASEVAARVEKKELDLGILQGVEFAWEQEKHPEIRALAIIVNCSCYRQADLIVRKNGRVTCWSDLKGGSLAMPLRSREHCQLFLHGQCHACKESSESFFAHITTPANIEDALDDVADGVVDVALVDHVGSAAYARRKPGRFDKLTVLQTSGRFPDTVVVYRSGRFDAQTVEHWRGEFLRANKNPLASRILNLWMVTGFEPVPAGFDKILSEMRHSYPQACPPLRASGRVSANTSAK
jgi:ABC-type phosphate/phosphonate transport system substrate-binding protein